MAVAPVSDSVPGHGRSGGAPLASIEAMADWIVALLDAVGVTRASLVGHSMGSLVAIEAAARHPQRVAKIALIGSALPMPVAEPLLDAAWHDEPKAVPGLWLLGVNQRLMERQRPGVFGTDMAACNAYARSLDGLATIAAPVLVIAGGQDRMTPPKASKAIAAAIPGARLTVIAGSGHALMAEAPDAVLDSLIDFIP